MKPNFCIGDSVCVARPLPFRMGLKGSVGKVRRAFRDTGTKVRSYEVSIATESGIKLVNLQGGELALYEKPVPARRICLRCGKPWREPAGITRCNHYQPNARRCGGPAGWSE